MLKLGIIRFKSIVFLLRINVRGKQGWIYAGKPNDPWVSFNDEANTIISDGNHNSKNDLKN